MRICNYRAVTRAGPKAAIKCNEGSRRAVMEIIDFLYNLFFVSENAIIEKPKRATISEYELCKSVVDQSLKQKSAEDEKPLISSLFSTVYLSRSQKGVGCRRSNAFPPLDNLIFQLIHLKTT